MKYIIFIIAGFVNFYSSSQDVFEAVRIGNIKLLDELYHINPDTLESLNENGFTPLIIACYRNNDKCVEYLIQKKVNVDQSSQEGTALLGACYKGNLKIVKHLLDAGAEVNTTNRDGTTPLIFAVLSKNMGLIKVLIENKADVSLTDNRGLSAADYAEKLGIIEFDEFLK